MLNQESLVDIHVLHRQGHSIRAISRQLGIARNTVRSYLRNLARTPAYGPRSASASKLDPFKPYLHERIEAAKPYWIPATVLHRELATQGFDGKEGIVRNYIRQFKSGTQEAVVRFETLPGQQMQVDFTTIRRGHKKLKGFVATLGYSRASYVRFSTYERQDDWLLGIEEAFHYFGGVPKEVLFDNAKCIMIERDAYGDGRHRWNAQLLQLSADYGFRLRACRPYRAKTKGKVERFNGYLKNSFITPLAATLKQAGLALDVDAANGQIGQWLNEVAHQRIHGTTKQRPQSLLIKERLSLADLPLRPSRAKAAVIKSPSAMPFESFQHPLSVYDQLLEAAR
jgi:transposase